MVASRIQLPTGCWNGGLGPCWDVGRSFLIHGPLFGVAHDVASSFHQNSQAREDEQDGSHNLFVNNLESDIPSLCCIIYWQWVTSSAYTRWGREHHKDRRQDWVGLGGHVRCCLPQHSSQKILHNMYYNLEFVFLLARIIMTSLEILVIFKGVMDKGLEQYIRGVTTSLSVLLLHYAVSNTLCPGWLKTLWRELEWGEQCTQSRSCSSHFSSDSICQNLITWPHSAAKEARKCSLWLGSINYLENPPR